MFNADCHAPENIAAHNHRNSTRSTTQYSTAQPSTREDAVSDPADSLMCHILGTARTTPMVQIIILNERHTTQIWLLPYWMKIVALCQELIASGFRYSNGN